MKYTVGDIVVFDKVHKTDYNVNSNNYDYITVTYKVTEIYELPLSWHVSMIDVNDLTYSIGYVINKSI